MTEATKTAADLRVGDVVHHGVKWGKVNAATASATGVRLTIGTSSAKTFPAARAFRVRVAATR